MIQFQWYKFSDLTINQLYEMLALRSDVFVVEQNCVFLDPDGKDFDAIHLLGQEDQSLVAYMRLIPPTEKENFIFFGRIVTRRIARTKGYGNMLMTELLSYCDKYYPNILIKCSAQYYLKKFYEKFGLNALGEPYGEDGILHIAMQK
jgi:ElaA protein